MNPKYKQCLLLYGALALVGALAIGAGVAGLGSVCPAYRIAGVPCPACGMSHAWMAALSGGFSAALGFHPLFWTVAFLPLLAFLPRRIANRAALAATGVYLAVWAIRLAAFFPNPPMAKLESALVPALLQWAKGFMVR